MNDDLPYGWTRVSPDDVATTEKHALAIGPFGSNLKVSDYRAEGVPLIFVRHIRSARFDNKGPFVSVDKAAELSAHAVRAGDVLVTKMGEPPGDSALYPQGRPLGIITADCIKWSIDRQVGLAPFFEYALRTFHVKRQIAGITQGVAQRKISLERFKSIKVPCAPLPEQARIVDALDSYLSRLDAAVATLEAAQAKLKAYRASVLKAAVEGRLVTTEAALARAEKREFEPADVLLKRILSERRRRWEEAELAKLKAAGKSPRDDNWKARYEEPNAPDTNGLPELPEGWCWATSDQLFSFVTSGSRGWAQYYSDAGPIFIRIGNLDHDSISLDLAETIHVSPPASAEGTRTRVIPGDILVSITADVGMIALVGDHIGEAYTNQHVSLVRPVTGPCRAYLAWYLACRDGGQSQFLKMQRGATKVGLGLDDIRSVLIPLAPAVEQERIVAETERLLSVAAYASKTADSQLDRAARLRQSILKWAFEGKLVNQDPNDEPAGKLLERIRAERNGASSSIPKRRGRRAPSS